MSFELSWIADAERFIYQDFAGTVHSAFYENRDQFGQMLVNLVRQNTPVGEGRPSMGYAGGALMDSITYEYDKEHEDGLVFVFADEATQIEAWNRVYDVYQEGEPLGLETYTNEGHQMFYKAQEQTEVMGDLAQQVTQRALDRLAEGRGMPFA